MGKKSKSGGGGSGEKKEKQQQQQQPAAREVVLKVAMHCKCNGCIDKIRGAVKGLPLLQGVEAMDQSAVESKGEVRLVATADPDKLRRRLHKATGKKVDLLLLPQTTTKPPAAQAILGGQLLQQQPAAGGAYVPVPGGGGWGAGSYPWAVQPPAEAYSYYSSPYPAASAASAAWAPYAAYPPPAHELLLGVHGGGAPAAWHARGY